MADSLDERLRRLEDRLARLEARLGIGDPPDDVIGNLAYRKRSARGALDRTPAVPPPLPPLAGLPPPPPPSPAEAAEPALPPFADLASTGPTAEPLELALAARADVEDAEVEYADVIVVPVDYAAPPPPLAPSGGVPQGDLERAVGLKWAGWLGAAVLVVGVGLGIKFAYDQGWLGGLPDVVKLLLMSLGGFALIAAGEVVLRRVNRLSAAGLFGAGVAVLFVVGYAGHAWYAVYARNTAFGLMGLATVVGVLLAARADLVSVAVLSLLGGYAAPILLAADAPAVGPFLAYLLLLQLLALTLCHWRASAKWWTLRSLALAATLAWELVVALPTDKPTATVAAFAVLYAVLFQLELAMTTLRVARTIGLASEKSVGADESLAAPPRVPAHIGGPAPVPAWRRPTVDPNVGLLFSMFVTAHFVLVVLLAYDEASRGVRGAWVLATAAACLAAGVVMLGRRATLGRLSLSLRAQAAALTVLAVPVLFDRQNVVFGWLALAAAFAAAGARVRSPLARAAAASTWMLAVAALVHWVSDGSSASDRWFGVGGVDVTAALFTAFVAAVVGHVVALLGEPTAGTADADRAGPPLARPPAAKRFDAFLDGRPAGLPSAAEVAKALSTLIHALAALVWGAAAVLLLPPLPGTCGLLVYVAAAWAASGWPRFRSLAYLSAAAVLAAAIKWVGLDLLADRLAGTAGAGVAVGTAIRPLVNAHMMTGVMVAAAMAGVGWTRRDVLLPRADAGATALLRSALTAGVAVLLTIGLTVETWAVVADASAAGPTVYPPAVATQLAWTTLWTAAAALVLASDRLVARPPNPAVARLAAAALILVAAKHLLVDAVGLRVLNRPVATTVVLNLQCVTSAVAAGGLILAAFLAADVSTRSIAKAGVLVVLLTAGSVEVDRFAVQQSAAPAGIVRQAGLSVWWSAFAIGCVVAGFAGRSAALRVAGLGLFGLTLVKVVLVDLSAAGTGWRILSFLGLGLLLLGTSVLYGRFGPALLKDE